MMKDASIRRTKPSRVQLDPAYRDPNWKPKKQFQVMSLATFNSLFGTKYSQHDSDLIAEDLQVSTIAEVPFGRHRMILLDADEAMERAKLLAKGAITSPNPITALHNLQAALAVQQYEIDRLRKELDEKK